MINENNLPHELLLTTSQKAKLRNVFKNNVSTDIKLSNAQISKLIQSGELLSLLVLLSRLEGPLMKVAVPLPENILARLRITAAASGINAGNQKKIHGSGSTTLIMSNKELNGIMKIV